MKTVKKVLISSGIVVVVLAVIAVAGVSFFAKPVVVDQLEKNLKIKVKLERIELGFPLSVTLTKLELGDFAAFDKISVYPSFLGMFTGKIVLNSVTVSRPVITIVRSPDGVLMLPQPEQKGGGPAVIITGLRVTGGKITFIDKMVREPEYAVVVDALTIDIAKTSLFPGSQKIQFLISAKVGSSKDTVPGSVSFSGWVDFGPKDMDGLLQVSDVEVTSFSPYYGNFISDKKLISGKLSFKADMKAKSNDLIAACHLELGKLVYAKESSTRGSMDISDYLPGALDFFADNKGLISLDFPITTKLDNPVVDQKVLQKTVMDAALKKLSNKSPQDTVDIIEGFVDQFKKLKGD